MALSTFLSLTPPSASSVAEVPSISSTTFAVGFSSAKVSSARALVANETAVAIERHSARIIAMSTLFLFESLLTIFPPTPLEYFLGTFLPLRDFSCEARETGYIPSEKIYRIVSTNLFFTFQLYQPNFTNSIYCSNYFIHYVDMIFLTKTFLEVIMYTICII
jgi:hypothetical protein